MGSTEYNLAERMGFEPMCREPGNRISSAARYDLFDTLPEIILFLKIFASK